MPSHMNVLRTEADVLCDTLNEMGEVDPTIAQADGATVIGKQRARQAVSNQTARSPNTGHGTADLNMALYGDPTLPPPVDVVRLVVWCSVMVLVVFTILKLDVPPGARVAWLGLFTGSALAGAALSQVKNLRSFWLRLAAALLVSAVLTVAVVINTRLEPSASASMASNLFGLPAGWVLVALTRRR